VLLREKKEERPATMIVAEAAACINVARKKTTHEWSSIELLVEKERRSRLVGRREREQKGLAQGKLFIFSYLLACLAG
jgi:hypothetical protein